MFRASAIAADGPIPYDIVVLTRDERHLRRRVLTLQHGEPVLIDLDRPTMLRDRDRLVLDDGRHIEVIAADEPLYAVSAPDAARLACIAWHLGNRHARVELDAGRLLIARDHVLADMLIGLGAVVSEIEAPFDPDPPVLHGVPHNHAHD